MSYINGKMTSRLLVPILCLAVSLPLAAEQSSEGSPASADAAPKPQAAENRKEARKPALERQKRFLQRALEDLTFQKSQAEEAVTRLDRAIGDIRPLEPLSRESDLRRLSDWYYDYIVWLNGRISRLEADLALNMDGIAVSATRLFDHYRELDQRYRLLRERLDERVKQFEADQRRIESLLDRRRILNFRLRNLEERLKSIEDRLTSPSERKEESRKLETDIAIIQNDLAALPRIDEELLRHYDVMIEEGRGESERLDMKIEEYQLLRDAVPAIFAAAATPEDAAFALRDLIGQYERQIAIVDRRIEDYYRRRTAVPPAGRLRERERAEDLRNYYQTTIQNLQDYRERLRVLVSDLRYELQAVQEGKGR